MPSTEKPAGFFSTFSILDPNGTHEGNPRAQKRNRRVFVCIPCHRRKLKCDKGQPCSRCTQSGSVDECIYQPLLNSSAVKRESITPEPLKEFSSPLKGCSRPQDRTRSSYRVSDGKARVSGSTHWAKIACEVCSMRYLICRLERMLALFPYRKLLRSISPALSAARPENKQIWR